MPEFICQWLVTSYTIHIRGHVPCALDLHNVESFKAKENNNIKNNKKTKVVAVKCNSPPLVIN